MNQPFVSLSAKPDSALEGDRTTVTLTFSLNIIPPESSLTL
ncbi:MAG: hypothetical protein AAGD25_00275 [Cyanobacteria bacterium P01_F01_bin.150]